MMICQKCGQNPAAAHIKQVINGKVSEYHLCRGCASEAGYVKMMEGMSFGLGDFLGSVFEGAVQKKEAPGGDAVCKDCGASFQEFAASGKAGCAGCYKTFYDRLLPFVQRIHGKARHVGKMPSGAGVEARKRRRISDLKQQLQNAVEQQLYEQAAGIRDEIKEIEGQVSE